MKLAIVEDHHLIRKAIIKIVKTLGEYDFTIEASNGKDFVDKYAKLDDKPEICIIDIRMPEMDGFELAYYIKKNISELKVLVLTLYDEEYYLIKMMKYGVNGYLLKNCDPDEIHNALQSISKNSFYYNNIFSKSLKNLVESNVVKLINITDNEKLFLEVCGEDLTYGQIAIKMNKTQRSVEGYKDSLFKKFQVYNRASLVLVAIKLGIIKV